MGNDEGGGRNLNDLSDSELKIEIDALFSSGNEEACDFLTSRNFSKYPERFEPYVVRNIWKVGGDKVYSYLINIAENGSDQLKCLAIGSLTKIGNRNAAPVVLDLMKNSTNGEVRGSASRALGEIGQDVVESLIKLVVEERRPLRNLAARALGLLGDRKAVLPLIEAFKYEFTDRPLSYPFQTQDWSWKQSKVIAIALCNIGDIRAMNAFESVRNYPSEYIQTDLWPMIEETDWD